MKTQENKQKAIELAYDISEDEIKEGDLVVHTGNKNNKPRIVVKSKFGILGVNLEGWFSWSPIIKEHKKVILKKNK